MKKGILWVVGVVAIVVIVSVSSGKKSTQNNPIRIGGAFMLTGTASILGEYQKNAVTLAVDNINAAGGIKGRPVELVIQDSTYDSKNAISAYNNLKQQGIHFFVIDGSPVISAVGPLVAADKNFSIAAVAYASGYFDGDNHTCRIALTAKTIAPGMSELALSRGYKKVAILMANSESGKSLADEFAKSYKAGGGVVVATELFDATVGASDFRTNLTKIKAVQSEVDAIVFSSTINTLPAMLEQMRTLGINKQIVTEIGTIDNPTLKGDLSAFEKSEFVGYEYITGDNASDSDATKKFKQEYKSKYGKDSIFFTAGQYDVTMLLAKAIGAAGEDPDKVADYISSLKDYHGITGTYSFNSDCEVSRPSAFYKIQGGKIVRTN